MFLFIGFAHSLIVGLVGSEHSIFRLHRGRHSCRALALGGSGWTGQNRCAGPRHGMPRGAGLRYNGPPVLRRLFTLASAVSLLVCVAMVAILIRTYIARDRWQYMDRSAPGQPWHISQLYIQTFRGEIWVGKLSLGTIPPPTQPLNRIIYNETTMRMVMEHQNMPHGWRSTPPDDLPPEYTWHGFNFHRPDPTTGLLVYSLILPCWSLVLSFLILPIVWITRRFRSHPNINHCVNCRYNTGNTSGMCCPECGTPVAGKAGA